MSTRTFVSAFVLLCAPVLAHAAPPLSPAQSAQLQAKFHAGALVAVKTNLLHLGYEKRPFQTVALTVTNVNTAGTKMTVHAQLNAKQWQPDTAKNWRPGATGLETTLLPLKLAGGTFTVTKTAKGKLTVSPNPAFAKSYTERFEKL